MSRRVGAQLPDEAIRLLGHNASSDLEDRALTIHTIDEQGWPHPALLSYGDIVAVSPRTLSMALYAESATSNNLRTRGLVTVCLVDESISCYMKGTAREIEKRMEDFPRLARFSVQLRTVLVDGVPETEDGAHVTSSITFSYGAKTAELQEYWNRLQAALAQEGAANGAS